MKKILALSILASGLLMAGGDIAPVEPVVEVPVMAEVVDTKDRGFYLGLGYAVNSTDESHKIINEDSSWDSDNVALIAGYNYNQFLALEARYTTSVGDLDYDGAFGKNSSYDGSVSNFAAYVKGSYPVGQFVPYAAIGYGSFDVDYENENGYSGSEESFQWILGAAYRVTPSVDLFVDYTSFYDGDGFDGSFAQYDYEISAYTFGVNYRF